MATETEPTNYRGYALHIDPSLTEFSARICYIKQGGLTVTKATGATPEAAIGAAKRLVDFMMG